MLTRPQIIDRIERELSRTRSCLVDRYAVLCVDIDRFRFVNASLGREACDQILTAIAARISSHLSLRDALARLGGDEFAVLVEESRAGFSAADIAEAIQGELIAGFEIDGTVIYSTASIGIARVSSSYESAEHVMRDAEIAMHGAKSKGRARAENFHPLMRAQARNLFALETELRRAVDRGEFELQYQPIVSLKTGKVRAFESLVRWRHPSRGLQMPSSFLPLLTETGLLLTVSEWVIDEACRQARKWQELRGRPVPLTVNIAAQHFADASIAELITDALDRTGAHPSGIVLEMPESILVCDLDGARDTLLALRERGIHTVVDDFGSGYSSPSYLRRLPVDAIKIDASLIDKIERFTEDRLIVRHTIALAHALGLRVIAEGMERKEQLVELMGFDCNEAQGQLISAPVDEVTATTMVITRWFAESIAQ